MIKILIIDDHVIFREGLKKVMSTESDIRISDEVGNGEKALRLLATHYYDIVLLDLSLPDMDGFDVLRTIRKQSADLPVLILSFFPEEQYAVRSLKEGAAGYITKEIVPKELVRAIRKVVTGGKYISTRLAESLADSLTEETKRYPHDMLSAREFQVFKFIAEGKSVKEMSCQLSLARTTVTSYRSRIFEKLNFKTNADLIRYAVENQMF
jgi:DNA-binding NarL/FixJ family response regulator